jgi:hypothetical protein
LIKFILSIIHFIGALLILSYQAILCYFNYRKHILPLLKPYKLQNDGSLTKQDFNKINFFGIVAPLVMGFGFSLLKNRKLTKQEKYLLMVTCSSTPLFDDFFDDKNLSINQLHLFYQNISTPKPASHKEALFYKINLLIEPHFATIKEISKPTLEAQMSAQRQGLPAPLSQAELLNIAYNKGGQSSLFYWHVIGTSQSKELDNLVFHSGALLQLTDDIFDVWFDNRDGLQTIATHCASFNSMYNEFNNALMELKTLCKATTIPTYNKRLFLQLQYILHAATLVALEQLRQLKIADNNSPGLHPNLKQYSRQQLVCDMDLWSNKIRWWHFYRQLATQP